jgi:pilus assembly protein CpaC
MALALSLLMGTSALAANLLERIKDQEITQVLRLRVGHSKVLRTPFAITRISVADPDVADIILISEKEIYVNALAPGVTNLSLWGKARFTTATVTVEADVSLLKEKLHQILPKEKIGVEAAGESIVLSGEVSAPSIQDTAVSLALPYVGGKKDKVVSLLHVGGVQQVLVEVHLAEINRTVGERMGVNFTAINTKSGDFGVNQINNLTTVTDLLRSLSSTLITQTLTPNLTALAGFKVGGTIWTMFFDVLKQQGLGKTLAEPNLVTTSGQEASFLAGGEFPIPVPQASGGGTTITIEYKKFGVGLVFTPTVLEDSKIAMRIAPEVTDLDFSNAAIQVSGFTIPFLSVRRTSTNVEMKDGQTFAIAGLLNDQHRNVVNKFPILGDIPILGALFRSSNFQKKETELVVLVTPHLVKPMAPGVAKLSTEKYIEPNDMEFYLMGAEQGKGKKYGLGPPQAPAAPPSSEPLPPGFGRQSVD